MAGIVLRLLILSACLCAASLYAGGVQIRAYNIDYNWDSPDKYINSFAAPGRWADANPKELMRWYEGMGCNAVHSFGVSCNGYAWYKGGKVVAHDYRLVLIIIFTLMYGILECNLYGNFIYIILLNSVINEGEENEQN